MAEHIRGTIQYVPEARTFKNTKYYSIKVNDVYYSVGDKQPPEAGVLVEFDAEKNQKGYWNVTKAGLSVIKAVEPTQAVAKTAVNAAQTSSMSKDDYWRRKEEHDREKEATFAEKDKRIELQSCRNSAVAVVDLLVRPGPNGESLIKLPAQAKREQFVLELVENYTKMFVEQNNNKKNETNDEEPKVSTEVSIDPADAAEWATI